MAKVCKKLNEKNVDSNDIWKDDVLNRKVAASDFTNIINGIEQPFVLSVNASYGSGKSFFLERWAEELKKDENKYVTFFNSWKTDFEKDPLVPILSSILEQLPKDKIENIKEKATRLFGSLKKCINLAVEYVGGPPELLDKVKGIINTDEVLDNYQQRLNLIKDFKDEIRNIISDKKLIIIIDELERCRPTYAVEVLETIKHLFNIPNVIFILGIDREQLKHTIASLYGSEMDKEGYLKRFIDLELTLPSPNKLDFCNLLIKELDISNKNKSDENNYTNGINLLKDCFAGFANGYNLSLRDMSQCFTDIKIIWQMIAENHFNLVPLLAWLVILKHKNQKFFSNIQNITYEEACKECLPHFKSGESDLTDLMKEVLILVYINDLAEYQTYINKKIREVDVAKVSTPSIDKKRELNIHSSELEKESKLISSAKEFIPTFRQYNMDSTKTIEYLLKKMSYLSS
ncbi:MAG: P-loop NTPase fold protein [Alphaproteobacteria bacterium]